MVVSGCICNIYGERDRELVSGVVYVCVCVRERERERQRERERDRETETSGCFKR